MKTDNHKRKKNEPEGFDNALADSDGMRMGYHSEKGSINDDTSEGMRMGYHSEKANPSKHSKRLHQKHSDE